VIKAEEVTLRHLRHVICIRDSALPVCTNEVHHSFQLSTTSLFFSRVPFGFIMGSKQFSAEEVAVHNKEGDLVSSFNSDTSLRLNYSYSGSSSIPGFTTSPNLPECTLAVCRSSWMREWVGAITYSGITVQLC